jgi:O-succinylbenzoic acid--CoA ligase
LSGLSPLDDRFWTGEDPRILLPDPDAGVARAVAEALDGRARPASVVFSSSGSTGTPRLTVLTRAALEHSARLAVAWQSLGPADRLACVLPLHHVGGFALVARARASGASVVVAAEAWHPERFVSWCGDEAATIVSLVPTQVFDLVRGNLHCPPRLRAAVVGGGRLNGELESEARQLGWPVLSSYGMTECASQVATEHPERRPPGPGWLPVLDGWQTRLAADGRLAVRGDALFCGRVVPDGTGWCFEPVPLADGWFETMDVCDRTSTPDGQVWLHPRGRADDMVKIRGELVSLADAQNELEGLARSCGLDPRDLAVSDVPDPRTGARLVVVAAERVRADLRQVVDCFNRRAPAFARLEGLVLVSDLPRSPLGKLRRGELRRLAGAAATGEGAP